MSKPLGTGISAASITAPQSGVKRRPKAERERLVTSVLKECERTDAVDTRSYKNPARLKDLKRIEQKTVARRFSPLFEAPPQRRAAILRVESAPGELLLDSTSADEEAECSGGRLPALAHILSQRPAQQIGGAMEHPQQKGRRESSHPTYRRGCYGFGITSRQELSGKQPHEMGPGAYDVRNVAVMKWEPDHEVSHPAHMQISLYKSAPLCTFAKQTERGTTPPLSRPPGPGHYSKSDLWRPAWQQYRKDRTVQGASTRAAGNG